MPMLERRGAVAAAAVVAVLVVGAIGWALGRATAPNSTSNTTGAGSATIKTIGGIPVGVQHTRARARRRRQLRRDRIRDGGAESGALHAAGAASL